MDNKNSYETMIAFGNGNKRRAYAIQYIVDVRQDGKSVKLTLLAPFNTEIPDLGFDTEIQATEFFNNCIAKIEAYYKAIRPQKDDNNDIVQEYKDNENILDDIITKEQEKVSKLTNFITMLCDQTVLDYEVVPYYFDDKMKRLEWWVKNKAQECK